MSRIQLIHTYQYIISLENLLKAWQEFIPGKRSRKDVQRFELNLMSNIIALHQDLALNKYKHSAYQAFNISDPKPRSIHKARVRDRLLHHAIYRVIYPFFAHTFFADSFSCQLGKGTHRAIRRFKQFADKVSKNNTKTCWILKCDIKKFFVSIDHTVLLKQLESYIPDKQIINLLKEVISSFCWQPDKGLPLGNLTSQLFVNIYMNPFDRFVKHRLKANYYLRYADDFVFMFDNKIWLESLIPRIRYYLLNNLKLELHPNKVVIKTLASGIDFLGWVHFPKHRVLRTTTKRKMLARIKENPANETLQSYLGLLSHGNTYKLKVQVLNDFYLWRDR